jgi:uncharacterized repeat protein (TIGR04138 family)
MAEADPRETLVRLPQRDPRYRLNAYIFAFQALEYTMKDHLKLSPDTRRHISARELLEGMRDYAIQQYGFLARSVWESWGVYATSDWGAVIFNLIGANLMRADDNDRLDDFKGVFEFEEAFDQRWAFNSTPSRKTAKA